MAYREVINKLTDAGAVFRCQGILECLEKSMNAPDVAEAMKLLKNDGVVIMGRKISSYAQAALDILGIERYNGNDPEVIELIPDLKEYLAS
ncbi:MAG: hypothetical protein II882_02415 [Lachnospiraceae bacterium]|nr:hypothetical protein [Lachnospiraceae bacterium]